MQQKILECSTCKKSFYQEFRYINRNIKHNYKNYCSSKCQYEGMKIFENRVCKTCGNQFYPKSESQKFCSQSCSAIYNNTHKATGTRVSKLELYLQKELIKLYDFEIKFNSKEEINSELDIYIPSLKLAFELNGIFHYESIYGQDKLAKIQNNDTRKFQACLENSIELCIINTTQQKYFKEHTAKKYLTIILEIINKKILSSKDVRDKPREGTS